MNGESTKSFSVSSVTSCEKSSRTNVTSYTTIKDLSTYTVASTFTDGAGRTITTAT